MGYKEDIKEFRVAVDANIQKVDEFLNVDREPGFSEGIRRMQIVKDRLAEAKMWLGKCLEAYGSELPAEFRDKAQADIKTVPMNPGPMKCTAPERLTSLAEAESKGELVLNYANNLARGFNELLYTLSSNTDAVPENIPESKHSNNRIEDLKLTFEQIEEKLTELQEIKNRLINIIG